MSTVENNDTRGGDAASPLVGIDKEGVRDAIRGGGEAGVDQLIKRVIAYHLSGGGASWNESPERLKAAEVDLSRLWAACHGHPAAQQKVRGALMDVDKARRVNTARVRRGEMMKPFVKLFKQDDSGMPRFGLQTNISEEQLFWDHLCRALAEHSDGDPAYGTRGWLPLAFEVVAKMRGYKAEVTEYRIISAGQSSWDKSGSLIVDTTALEQEPLTAVK